MKHEKISGIHSDILHCSLAGCYSAEFVQMIDFRFDNDETIYVSKNNTNYKYEPNYCELHLDTLIGFSQLNNAGTVFKTKISLVIFNSSAASSEIF